MGGWTADEGFRNGSGPGCVLVGNGGRRAEYFERAAEEEGVCPRRFTWEQYPARRQPGDVVKLDPPPFDEAALARLPRFAAGYRRLLTAYESLEGVRYLNHPRDILAALDKREARERLAAEGVPIPPDLEAGDYAALTGEMERCRTPRVFIKPRYGSGASGVLAYARGMGREVLYTSLQERDGAYYNTKRIHTLREHGAIRRVIDAVLGMDAVVERWIPKESTGGVCYDLRVVWQAGGAAAIVFRGSRGPITNLHLNNLALERELSPCVRAAVEEACGRAMACFPGLFYGGIDVLLPRGGGAPVILEVNAQGDLIYRDIYAENRIYRQQIQQMKGMCSNGK